MCTCRCRFCNSKGATIGCRIDRCDQSFHLHCAKNAGCTFYPAKFLVACPAHAPAFEHESESNRLALATLNL